MYQTRAAARLSVNTTTTVTSFNGCGRMSSNTLAVLYTLGRDAARRCVSSPNRHRHYRDRRDQLHIDIEKLLAQFRHHGGFGPVATRPRAIKPVSPCARYARQFRAAGVP